MTNIKPLAAAVMALSLASITNTAAAAAVDDKIAELERQLAELKAQVTANQQQAATNTAEIEVVRPSKKGTRFQYGGFVQLDTIVTEYAEGRPVNALIEDFLVPSLIPVEPASGASDSYSSTNMHTKTSRFFFTTSTPTDAGTLSSRVELDFILSPGGDERISNSFNSRMRHAFLKWDYDAGKSLMAGQSWSTFFNVGALPGVQDFVGPVGTIFVRQPMIRWTSGGLQLAIENPATRLNYGGGDASRIDDAENMPDLIARYNGKAGGLSWSIAAMAREIGYEVRDGTAVEVASESEFGYGLSFAGKWMLGGSKNNVRYMLNYGSALGRYMGLNSFNDGYVDDSGSIETIDQWGAFVAYEHYWSDRWRSHFSLSASAADNPSEAQYSGAGAMASDYQSLHANLQWMPAPKLMLGGEYIYAVRELEDGREGDLSRLQFSVKYGF